jgi:hypothetical protein
MHTWRLEISFSKGRRSASVTVSKTTTVHVLRSHQIAACESEGCDEARFKLAVVNYYQQQPSNTSATTLRDRLREHARRKKNADCRTDGS